MQPRTTVILERQSNMKTNRPMKIQRRSSLWSATVLACFSVWAAYSQTNNLTFTSNRGVAYRNVTVINVKPDGLTFLFNDITGGGTIKFTDLPEFLQTRFGYDAQKAAAYETEQAKVKARQDAWWAAQQRAAAEQQREAQQRAADMAKAAQTPMTDYEPAQSQPQNDGIEPGQYEQQSGGILPFSDGGILVVGPPSGTVWPHRRGGTRGGGPPGGTVTPRGSGGMAAGTTPRMAPDFAGGTPRMAPNPVAITPRMAPNSVGVTPRMAPDFSGGTLRMAPSASYVGGTPRF
jgi:hypothetical protein